MLKKIQPSTVNLDIPASEQDDNVWSDVNNMYFKAFGSVRAEGWGNIFNPAVITDPYHLQYHRQSGLHYWVYAGDQTIGVTDLVTHWDITPPLMSPTEPERFVGGNLNSITLLTNSYDPPWYWQGDPLVNFAELPNWPADTRCKWIRPFRYNAIAGNITENGINYENQLYWSASVTPGNPPDDWQPLPTNDAGDNILASTQGEIVDGMQLRDFFIIAKRQSMYVMRYIGGLFIFDFTELTSSIGVLAPNCMVGFEGRLFVFGDGDIVVTDGSQIQSIADLRVRRTIFDEMNQDIIERCFVVAYGAKRQIWFCYPSGGNTVANKAAIYSMTDDSWGFRDLPQTYHAAQGVAYNYRAAGSWEDDLQPWDLDNSIWDSAGNIDLADNIVMTSTDEFGRLYGVDFTGNKNGQPMTGKLAKNSMDFGDALQYKIIRRVWPYVVGQEGMEITIRIGTQGLDADPVTWTPPQKYIFGETDYINVLAKGRLISLEIVGEPVSAWRVYSVSFEYDVVSRF